MIEFISIKIICLDHTSYLKTTAGIESVLCVDALGPIESELVVALE